MNYFDLTGKKAIVTGGSRGLGLGMAEGLASHGAEVVIMASSNKVFSAVEELKAKNYKIHGVQVDFTKSPEIIEEKFKEAVSILGGIDILLNAAGIQRRHKSEEFPLSDWNDVINVNLTSVFILCQLGAKEMLKQKKGKIINIASMLSFFGGYTVPAYAASKGGVAQLTKAFANEWAEHNINVNAIAPGYMATDMNEAILADVSRNEEILKRIPQKRWGTSEDMQGTAIFLASEASNYLNGAIIPVDGGYLGR